MRREARRTPLLFIDGDGAKRDSGLGKSNLPSLSPVARDTLQEQAYLRLREALMSGHFVPGQAITLRAAAEALGTSPMPVRDALRRLEIEHALVPRSNRTLGVPEMSYVSLTELREVRMALEGLAAEKAALLITNDEIAAVESHYQALVAGAAAGSPADYMRANWLLHTAIYRASRSHLLVSLIEPTWMRIGPYVRLMLPDRRALMDSLANHLRALLVCGGATALARAKRFSGTSSNQRKDWRACCARAKKHRACALLGASRHGAAPGCEKA
jgi:DNA-binding GntR family transcriptional regulator